MEEYNKVIPELASKVEKMKAVRNVYFVEPTVNLSVFLCSTITVPHAQ
jgi:hypothetical protein